MDKWNTLRLCLDIAQLKEHNGMEWYETELNEIKMLFRCLDISLWNINVLNVIKFCLKK